MKALSTLLIQNSLNAAYGTTDNQHRYILPFLPSMFGAGKTTIGKHLLPQAKKHKEDIFQRLKNMILPPPPEAYSTNLPRDQQEEAWKQKKTQLLTEQLDKFLGATYVHVSMDKLSRYVLVDHKGSATLIVFI